MFTPDVVSLKQFYASPLGECVARAIGRAVARLWPAAAGELILGVGYTPPFMQSLGGEENQLLLAMPAFQGAVYWPVGKPNLAFLTEESQLPLPSGQFNRVLMIHAADGSEQLHPMLQEVWRLLTPGGRMLMVVPHRRSFWARSPRSPFGYGRPFTLSQVKHLLAEEELNVTRVETALHLPPLRNRWALKAMPYAEIMLRPLGMLLGGVLLVEAEKQLYAPIREPAAVPARRRRAAVAVQPALSRSLSQEAALTLTLSQRERE